MILAKRQSLDERKNHSQRRGSKNERKVRPHRGGPKRDTAGPNTELDTTGNVKEANNVFSGHQKLLCLTFRRHARCGIRTNLVAHCARSFHPHERCIMVMCPLGRS